MRNVTVNSTTVLLRLTNNNKVEVVDEVKCLFLVVRQCQAAVAQNTTYRRLQTRSMRQGDGRKIGKEKSLKCLSLAEYFITFALFLPFGVVVEVHVTPRQKPV